MSEMNGDRGPGSGIRDPGSGGRRSALGAPPSTGSGRPEPVEGRQEDALAEVDRELRAALSITPSADFEARVLRRIEGDRPVRSGVFGVRSGMFGTGQGLRTAALPAAASIVLVAGLFYALNRAPEVDPQLPSQAAVHRPPAANPPQAGATVANDDPVLPAAVAPVRAAAERTQRLAARSREPEVILPLNQMEAVRRLVRAVNEGRIEAPAEPPQGPMAPPAELAIAPLVVEPIPVPALDPVAGEASPAIRRSY